MPSRNTTKEYVANSYYHIYNRGLNKQTVFHNQKDFLVFLGLLKRYLGNEVDQKPNRTLYPNFHDQIELLAYCLMPNHYHLFIYQHQPNSISELMKSLGVAYTMYFNKKHMRTGSLFQQRYKAIRITDDDQLLHITRYLHLNPDKHMEYQWSSLPYYLGQKNSSWLRPQRVLELFGNGEYKQFLEDYKDKRDELKILKHELDLANQ